MDRINEVLDEYNVFLGNLDQLDEEVALHIMDELRAEFMDLTNNRRK